MLRQCLYAITGGREEEMAATVAAIEGGCGLVQYRDKSTDRKRRRDEATRLMALCEAYQCRLIINDDIVLAKAVGAHGVHLGQDDDPLERARDVLGASAIVGATCHASLDLAVTAQERGADYVAFGRFFASQTKPEAPPAAIDILTRAKNALNIPIAAIGGITPDNAAQLVIAGADILAVGHALFGAENVKSQARLFCKTIREYSVF